MRGLPASHHKMSQACGLRVSEGVIVASKECEAVGVTRGRTNICGWVHGSHEPEVRVPADGCCVPPLVQGDAACCPLQQACYALQGLQNAAQSFTQGLSGASASCCAVASLQLTPPVHRPPDASDSGLTCRCGHSQAKLYDH